MKQIKILSTILFVFNFIIYAQSAEYDSPAERLQSLNKQQQKTVEFLYRKWYSGPFHYMVTGGRRTSRIMGRWANSPRSKSYIPYFVKNYSINVDEIAQPLSSFTTFNKFFTRKLKPESRPLPNDPYIIISPADGNALVMQNINEHTLFPTKTITLSTKKMLQDDQLAKQFKDGTAIIIRLAPWDYHRFHFPTDGIPGKPHIITGRFESVSPTVYQARIQPLEVNERHIVRFQSDTASTIAIVLVGALFVGAIVETYTPGKKYLQGDEMGYFEYGGSTIVLLFQKNTIQVVPEIIANSAIGKETPVKMGEIIGYVTQKERMAEE